MKAKNSILLTMSLILLFGLFLWMMAVRTFQGLGFDKSAEIIALVAVFTFVIATAMFRWVGRDWVSHILTLLAVSGLWGTLLGSMPDFIVKISGVIGKFVKVASTETIAEVTLFIGVGLIVCSLNWVIDQFGIVAGVIHPKSWFKRTTSRMVVPVTLLSIIGALVYFGNGVKPSEIVQIDKALPEQEEVQNFDDLLSSKPVSGYPESWVERLKVFENEPLASGAIKESIRSVDALVKKRVVNQVGYGITAAEIAEAKRLGFLPANATLPKKLTKAQADKWMTTITIPTYEKQVEEIVKAPLSPAQKFALISFCHNVGKNSLRELVNKKDRLNDGNYLTTCAMIEKYEKVSGEVASGLAKRRLWEAGLFASGFSGSETKSLPKKSKNEGVNDNKPPFGPDDV